MADKEGKQFLVLLSINPCTPARLLQLVPALKSLLEEVSTQPIEQLFRSMGGDHFGYLIRSKMAARQILAAIETPQKWPVRREVEIREPFSTGKDAVIIMELGQEIIAHNAFSRAITWIQRH